MFLLESWYWSKIKHSSYRSLVFSYLFCFCSLLTGYEIIAGLLAQQDKCFVRPEKRNFYEKNLQIKCYCFHIKGRNINDIDLIFVWNSDCIIIGLKTYLSGMYEKENDLSHFLKKLYKIIVRGPNIRGLILAYYIHTMAIDNPTYNIFCPTLRHFTRGLCSHLVTARDVRASSIWAFIRRLLQIPAANTRLTEAYSSFLTTWATC